MKTICVCGAGTMGSGIAQVSAAAGFNTVLFDVADAAVQKASEKLRQDFETLVKKGKLSATAADETFARISFTTAIDACKADLIIEAVVEKIDVKVSLFNRLAAVSNAQTIFASNTSSLSITALAKQVQHPARVAGLHFFNPAPLMKLVEVVKGKETAQEVIEQLIHLTKTLGKVPVVCNDSPGFIVNRVARPYYIEALRLIEEGKATFETVDRLLESTGFKMGPFKLMDLIGNDVNYAVSCSVYDQLGSPERLKPSCIQKEKVEKGELGKKTAKGYYTYS